MYHNPKPVNARTATLCSNRSQIPDTSGNGIKRTKAVVTKISRYIRNLILTHLFSRPIGINKKDAESPLKLAHFFLQ